MKQLSRIGIFLTAIAIVSVIELEIEPPPSTEIHVAVSTAEAVVGRPLTPVSVAGVARRTVRRCAVGVYNCY